MSPWLKGSGVCCFSCLSGYALWRSWDFPSFITEFSRKYDLQGMHFKDVRACREKWSPSQATACTFLITQTSVLHVEGQEVSEHEVWSSFRKEGNERSQDTAFPPRLCAAGSWLWTGGQQLLPGDSSTKVPEDEQEVNATNCGDPSKCKRECHRAFSQHLLLPHL